jgi:membrane-bound lytic murein transglycosylase A
VNRAGALAMTVAFSTAASAIAPPTGADALPRQVGTARLDPLSFESLAGWAEEDHRAAYGVFRRTCEAIASVRPALRPAAPADDNLRRVCEAGLAPDAAAHDAKRFFEGHFEPFAVLPESGAGFLTGYFEPEVEGSLTPTDEFPTPALARPDDLVTIAPGEAPAGLDPTLQGARRTDAGLEPYPDRAAIEDGALGDRAKPLLFLRDPVELFIVQVQGSARIRLANGRVIRLAYAGRNGLPYTSIGRVLIEEGHIPPDEMSLDRLTGWLRAHLVEARHVMRRNRSYVFFRIADELEEDQGPIGGAGIQLEPGRSLAVDRNLWSYGLPVWLEGELPLTGGGAEPLRRLMVAQDTGSAILGPARGDFFMGSGPVAGHRAGLLRHPVRFVVLLPKAPAPP